MEMYDPRGALIVWDDPDQEACHHGNLVGTCQTCLAEEQEAEEIGEALERQRQPENQPIPELRDSPCWHGDSRSCRCEDGPPRRCPNCRHARRWEDLGGGGRDAVCDHCGRRGAFDE